MSRDELRPDTPPADSGEVTVTVTVHCLDGTKFSDQTSLSSTVRDFKAVVAESCDVAAEQQRLIYKGRILKDEETLGSYGLQADHTVHMVKGLTTSASASADASARNTTTPPTSSQNTLLESVESEITGLTLGGLGGSGDSEDAETTTVRPDVSGNARSPRSLGGVMTTALITGLLQDPEVAEMAPSMLSDPEYVDQMLNTHQGLRAIADSNPRFREMLYSPELIREVTTPEMLQEAFFFQLTMSSIENLPPEQRQAAGSRAMLGYANNPRIRRLMEIFGVDPFSGSNAPPNSNARSPEEFYASQLSQLQEMGFCDAQENIRVLQATQGNVSATVDRIVANLGQ